MKPQRSAGLLIIALATNFACIEGDLPERPPDHQATPDASVDLDVSVMNVDGTTAITLLSDASAEGGSSIAAEPPSDATADSDHVGRPEPDERAVVPVSHHDADAPRETGGSDSAEGAADAPEEGGDGEGSSPDDVVTDAMRCDVSSCAATCGSLTSCDGSCVDLASSGEHCGQCHHACGGGACTGGRCQPHVVAPLVNALALSVDDSGVYFTTDDNRVLACPLAGCGTTPPHQISAGVPVQEILARDDSVIFVGKDLPRVLFINVYICPKTGCPSPLPVLQPGPGGNHGYGIWGLSASEQYVCWRTWAYLSYGVTCCSAAPGAMPDCTSRVLGYGQPDLMGVLSGTQGSSVTIDGDDIFFTGAFAHDAGPVAALARCAISTNCSGGSEELSYARLGVAALDGTLFLTNGSSITSCPKRDCSNESLVVSTKTIALISELAVDASGIYWLEDSAGGALKRCALPNCVGGPQPLASSLGTARKLRLHDGFVYWIAPGPTTDDGGHAANSGAIMRVAK